MICSEKRTVCQERKSCKTMCFYKQVMAKNKDQCILSTPKRGPECSYAWKLNIYNVFHTVDTTQVLNTREHHLGRITRCDNKWRDVLWSMPAKRNIWLCTKCLFFTDVSVRSFVRPSVRSLSYLFIFFFFQREPQLAPPPWWTRRTWSIEYAALSPACKPETMWFSVRYAWRETKIWCSCVVTGPAKSVQRGSKFVIFAGKRSTIRYQCTNDRSESAANTNKRVSSHFWSVLLLSLQGATSQILELTVFASQSRLKASLLNRLNVMINTPPNEFLRGWGGTT